MEPSALLIDNAAPGEIEESSAISIDNNKNQPSSPTRELSASTMQRNALVGATGVAATSSASGQLSIEMWLDPLEEEAEVGQFHWFLSQLEIQSFAGGQGIAFAFYPFRWCILFWGVD